MSDYWEAPKVNWVDSDGIGYEDLNRIESNISANRDANFRKVQGFGYSIDNTVVGEDGVITILPGSCYSNNGIPIKMAANFVKNLTTWAAGNGAAFGGMAAAVTVVAHTWYYAFVIMDPTDGSTEIMLDDNASGANVSSGIYTEKRFINSFKTGAAGGDGSFDLIEMFSTGDKVFINPNSMYVNREIDYLNLGPTNGEYVTLSLTESGPSVEGYAVPARVILAKLDVRSVNIDEFGFISTYNNLFTIPTDLLSGSVYSAEFLRIAPGTTERDSATFEMMVGENRTFALAMQLATGTSKVFIAVVGFTDERLI